MKLDIGAGSYVKPGFTPVDKYVIGPNFIRADMWELPIPSGDVEEIHSSHALEHVGKYQIAPTLKEWLRVLRPGGRLELIVPDSEWWAANWLGEIAKHRTIGTIPKRDWHHDTLFGLQDHEGEFHKCAFTVELLKQDISEAGFIDITITTCFDHGQGSLRATAYKAS